MKKKKKIIVTAVIAVVIGALIVLLLVFPRKKGEWVFCDPYTPKEKLVSELGQFPVWSLEVNEENISHIPFYQYKFRKKTDMPVVRICVVKMKTGEIVSSVEADVGNLTPTELETEPIVFAGYPSLHGKRIGGKLIMYVPFTKEDIEKRVKMAPKVFTKGGKPL